MDILLDATFDLPVTGGDFIIGESDAQNIALLLRARKGAFKQSPLIGYGEHLFDKSPLDGEARRAIQLALEADGYRLRDLTLDEDGSLVITGA